MKKEDIMVLVLWVALLIVGLVLLYNLGSVIRAIGDIAAAFISALAVFIGAILTHALTQIRDQSNKQIAEKQKNYLKLIDSIDGVIRARSGSSDGFSKIHLESWVVGSDQVVAITQNLLNATDSEQKKEAIKSLLKQMRSEVGLPDLGEEIDLIGVFKTLPGL